jgi:aryl-alcohol dehydrogenase-like predicted oxidoreductase
LGNSELRLTTIGIGTWAIGGGDWKFGWGAQDETEAVRAIVHGIQSGLNWLDTAAVYGNGRSEQLVGRALRELGTARRPFVATKCGRFIQPDGNITGSLARASIIAECEASLRRLEIDCIDLYQLHWPDPPDQIEEGWQTLIELKQMGKVREIGVSNFSKAQMERIAGFHPIASLQPPYSMLARDIETETLPYCAQNRMGVIAYSPMGKGLLTGTFSDERARALSADDHRSRDPKFQPPLLELNLQLVEGLRPIAFSARRSVAELAIAWVLRRAEVTSAIVGARRSAQIDGTIGAADWRLSPDEIAAVDKLLEERQRALEPLGRISTGRV